MQPRSATCSEDFAAEFDSGGAIGLRKAGRLAGETSARQVMRWINDGFHGLRLEAVRTGKKYLTTAGALRRFLKAREAMTRLKYVTSDTTRDARLVTANAELDRLGIGV
jgi:hypothetical protein